MKKISLILLMILLITAWGASADKLQEYFKEGKKAYDQGNHKKAIDFYEKAVEVDPDFAPVYNALGLAHHENHADLSDVIWFFNVAIELDPNSDEAYGNMCKIYYQTEKPDLAERACLKAIEINPSMLSSKLYLAWVYLLGKRQPADAIYYFEDVIEKVDNPMIRFGLGLAYCRNGDTAQALDTGTILRGRGENELAANLEVEMRRESPPLQPNLDSITVPRKSQDRIVGQPQEPAPPPPGGNQSIGGGMQIRLKGKLTNPGGSSTDKRHPGSL